MINTTYYTRLKALYNGWRDGRRNYPAPDAATPSQYVREMKNACEHQLAHLAEKWKEQDKKLFAEYRTCKEHLDISERFLMGSKETIMKPEAAALGQPVSTRMYLESDGILSFIFT